MSGRFGCAIVFVPSCLVRVDGEARVAGMVIATILSKGHRMITMPCWRGLMMSMPRRNIVRVGREASVVGVDHSACRRAHAVRSTVCSHRRLRQVECSVIFVEGLTVDAAFIRRDNGGRIVLTRRFVVMESLNVVGHCVRVCVMIPSAFARAIGTISPHGTTRDVSLSKLQRMQAMLCLGVPSREEICVKGNSQIVIL